MTTDRLFLASPGTLSPSPSSAAPADGRVRWRRVRELLSGSLILAVWLALWTWLAVGVVAPLGRIEAQTTRAGAVELGT